MITSDLKQNLFRQIEALPENDLPELQQFLDELTSKRTGKASNGKTLSYHQRLKELQELVAQIPQRENWDKFIQEFEESRQDRPLPFRD